MTTLLDVPSLLALLAAVLCAVAIFAPARAARPAAISLAPPLAPEPPVERWSPPLLDDEPHVTGDAGWETPADPPAVTQRATWPLLIDARAISCDALARCDLVDALAALRAPWADAILERALEDEPDDGVRAALRRVLAAHEEPRHFTVTRKQIVPWYTPVAPLGTSVPDAPPTVTVNDLEPAAADVNVDAAVVSPNVVVQFAPATSASLSPFEVVPQVDVPFSVITNDPPLTVGNAPVTVFSDAPPAMTSR